MALLLLVLSQGAAVAQTTKVIDTGVVYENVEGVWTVTGIDAQTLPSDGVITIKGSIEVDLFDDGQYITQESIKEIANRAFINNTSINGVLFEEGIEKIGDDVFEGCTNVTQLVLPSTIKQLGTNAFGRNSNMRWIDMRNVDESDALIECMNDNNNTPAYIGVAEYTLVYMPDWSTTTDFPGYITNAVYTESTQLTCSDFQFSRSKDYCVPYGFTASKVTAYPIFSADDWAYSVCLPYDQPVPSGAKAYSLGSKVMEDGSTVVYFRPISGDMEAGKPYLLVATENVLLSCEGESQIPVTDAATTQSETVEDVTIHGTFNRINNADAANAGVYVLQTGNYWKLVGTQNSNVGVPPFRAYLTLSGAQDTNFYISLLDDTDGITQQMCHPDGDDGDWFTVYGRRLISVPTKSGMYIHKGMKIIIK